MNLIDKKFFEDRHKERNYLHFDKKRPPSYLCDYITNVDNITRHSFYPFISYTLTERKVKQGYIPMVKSYIHPSKGYIPSKPMFKPTLYPPKIIHTQFYPFISYKNAKQYAVPNHKTRLIQYASHFDSDIYAYYSYLLTPYYEDYLTKNSLDDCALAYRKIVRSIDNKKISKCNIHFSKDVFDDISSRKNCIVYCYDVSKFFDNLNHSILKNNWCNLLRAEHLPEDHYKVYKTLTRFAAVDKTALYKELGFSLNSRTLHKRLDTLCSSEYFRSKVRGKGLINTNKSGKGIPQGSPLSGLLSNIYMMTFDKNVNNYLKSIRGKYYRYSDDMIFIFEPEFETQVVDFLRKEIIKIKLTINNKKTQKVVFRNGLVDFDVKNVNFNEPSKLQYLGLLFDGEEIYLRDSGISRYNNKLRKAIRMRSAHYRKLKESDNLNSPKIYKRKLYSRFTYIGKSNYISYALRVSKTHKSKNVKRQIKGHYKLFNEYLDERI